MKKSLVFLIFSISFLNLFSEEPLHSLKLIHSYDIKEKKGNFDIEVKTQKTI